MATTVFKVVTPQEWTTGGSVSKPAVADANNTSSVPSKPSAQAEPPYPPGCYSLPFRQCSALSFQALHSSQSLHKTSIVSRTLLASSFNTLLRPSPDSYQTQTARTAQHSAEQRKVFIRKRRVKDLLNPAMIYGTHGDRQLCSKQFPNFAQFRACGAIDSHLSVI